MSMVSRKLAGNVATIFNGTSFLGRRVVSRLGKEGSKIVMGYRGARYDTEKLRVVGGLGQVYFSHYNLNDEQSLYDAMKYSDIVINTIGKFNETKNFTFEDVHIEGPRRLARIARECGVKKFIHFSALNASPDPPAFCLKNGSQFLRTKYYGELAVREEFPEAIIFRPADMLGEGDRFLYHFLELRRCCYGRNLPIWDNYYQVEKQPVFVNDVVTGIVNAILDDSADGKTFQAVGPYRYDFFQLIEYMRSCGGQGMENMGRITNLRFNPLMRMVIFFIERLQKYPFLTWERIEFDGQTDRIDPKLPTLTDLGVELTNIEPWIKTLAHYIPRFHRVEISFEDARSIDPPPKLNLTS